MKRFLAIVLCLIMSFQVIAMPAEAWYVYVISGIPNVEVNTDNTTHKYSSYWQYWAQGASKYKKMRDAGCRVVAQAKLLVETGVVSSDVNTFNPDIYLDWGMSQGFWPYADDDIWEQKDSGLAAITYAANYGVTLNKGYVALSGSNSAADVQLVMDYINAGYYIILHSSAHQAYVGRAASLNAGTPVILNSWNNKSSTYKLCESYSGHTLNYFTGFYYYAVNSDIPVTMSWINGTQTPRDTDFYAYMEACANISGTYQEAGITVWDAKSNSVVAQKSEVPGSSQKSLLPIWYNITEETGAVLNPGTTYLYQYHVKFNGTYYYSPVFDITTTGACSCTYGAWNIDTEATCTSDGSRSRSCTKCGATETQTIPATDHDWELTDYKEATCEESGSKTRTCSNCGQAKIEISEALGHNWQETGRIDATCQQAAGIIYTCDNCGDSKTQFANGEYSEWSETYPEGIPEERIETKTQYRYRDYKTTTSYDSYIVGMEQLGSEWVYQNTQTVDYAIPWPSGFYMENSLFKQYDNRPVENSETDTSKIVVTGSTNCGYIMWHWCRGTYTAGPINRAISDVWTGEFNTFHAFFSDNNGSNTDTYGTAGGGDHVRYHYNNACCADTYWYFAQNVTRQTYDTYRKMYTHGEWGAWSDWSDTAYSEEDTRQVETRTLYRYVNTPNGEHTWDEGVVSTPASCTEPGEKTYTCTLCGDTYNDSYTDGTGHSYGEWSTATAATCIEDGQERRDCANCDHYETRTIPAVGHNYTAVVTAPTCTEGGYTTYTCVCGDSYISNETAATGHDYTSVVTAPTCTEGGYTTYTCTCGNSYIGEETEATGHSYTAVVTAPTCTDGGYTTYTCSCGESYVDDETEPAHSYGEWTETLAPTATEEGEERRDCENCDHYEARTVDALELSAPKIKVSANTTSGKPKVIWEAVSGADIYRVYRATSKAGTYTRIKSTSSLSFTDSSAKVGKNYYYKVMAVDQDNDKTSEYSNIVNRVCDLKKPVVTLKVNTATGKPKLEWNAIDGAVKYRIYRATSKTGTYKYIKSTTSATSYIDTTAVAGKEYYYKVKALHENSSADSAYSDVVNRVCDLAKPEVSISLSGGNPKIKWNTVEDAEKYYIYRATSKTGTYTKVKTAVSARTYTDTSATAGKTYYYKVKAIHSSSAANSAYSAVKYIKAK